MDIVHENQVLLEMYKVQVGRSEHFEGLRERFTSLLLVITGALVGFVSIDEEANVIPISCLIVSMGAFGWVASRFHANRAYRHGKRAQAFREALSGRIQAVDEAYNSVIRESTHINDIWSWLNIYIIVVGVATWLLN